MSSLSDLGEEILQAQSSLGLGNPRYYRHGLTDAELRGCPLLMKLPSGSELRELFRWRNGMKSQGIPIGELWIQPGFHLMSVEESIRDNHYASLRLGDWWPSWYPILTDAGGSRRFCDTRLTSKGQVPVYYYAPDSALVSGRIYDSIQSMFATILECYRSGAYFVAPDGFVDTQFSYEIEISRGLNPSSDYWLRTDLLE
jgi:hypothetical protein